MAQEQAHAGLRAPPIDRMPAAAPSLEDYDRRLASEPGNERLHAGKVSLLCVLGRHEDALVACDAAIALRPGEARLLARKASILYRLGRRGEALEAIELAMDAPDGSAARGPSGAPPQAPRADADQALQRARVAMARELAGFIEYLIDKRIIDDAAAVATVEGSRNLQKYAYIAQSLGMQIGYKFDFIESGAFSTDLAVDAHRLNTSDIGTEKFRPDARASEEFVGLVSGKEAEWLQVATFAARARGADDALDAFVKARHARMDYDMSLINGVFSEVDESMSRYRCASQ